MRQLIKPIICHVYITSFITIPNIPGDEKSLTPSKYCNEVGIQTFPLYLNDSYKLTIFSGYNTEIYFLQSGIYELGAHSNS